MSWDPFQRAVLAELGHAVYRPPVVAQGVQVDDAVLARLAQQQQLTPLVQLVWG